MVEQKAFSWQHKDPSSAFMCGLSVETRVLMGDGEHPDRKVVSGGTMCHGTRVMVSSILGMKAEPWGSWREAGTRLGVRKELLHSW